MMMSSSTARLAKGIIFSNKTEVYAAVKKLSGATNLPFKMAKSSKYCIASQYRRLHSDMVYSTLLLQTAIGG